jgi:hypothetical protein
MSAPPMLPMSMAQPNFPWTFASRDRTSATRGAAAATAGNAVVTGQV